MKAKVYRTVTRETDIEVPPQYCKTEEDAIKYAEAYSLGQPETYWTTIGSVTEVELVD